MRNEQTLGFQDRGQGKRYCRPTGADESLHGTGSPKEPPKVMSRILIIGIAAALLVATANAAAPAEHRGVQQHKTSSSAPSPPMDFISKDVSACPTIGEVTPEGCDALDTLKLEKDQPVFVHKRVSPGGEQGPKYACVSNANFGRCYWLSSDYLTGETPVFGPVHHGRATCSRCRE
jgi:hypothetical protein